MSHQREIDALKRRNANLKEMLRISDAGWKFHNQRANEAQSQLAVYEHQRSTLDCAIGKLFRETLELKRALLTFSPG